MGNLANNIFSTMSWIGKNHDVIKPYDRFTASQKPVTEEDLAEFEKDLSKVIREMADKISSDPGGLDKE